MKRQPKAGRRKGRRQAAPAGREAPPKPPPAAQPEAQRPQSAPAPTIELRYFHCRGRAQFLRYYFTARHIDYTEERLPIGGDFAEWRALRVDRERAGPFQRLPLLRWNDEIVVETAVIADFLHERTGDAALLSAEENWRHRMIFSAAHIDMMLPLGTLLWAEVLYPGVELGTLAKRSLERLRSHLAALSETLEEWHWLERARERPVMVADCMLWEQLNAARSVFGERLDFATAPAVRQLYGECAGAPAFAAALEAIPCQITARPGEADAIARIREALAS